MVGRISAATAAETQVEGQIVLVREDNAPPSRWLMGRITEVFPGKDGQVRVATLRTQNSIMTRPIAKLSLLPTEDNYEGMLGENSDQVLDSIRSSNGASMLKPEDKYLQREKEKKSLKRYQNNKKYNTNNRTYPINHPPLSPQIKTKQTPPSPTHP